MHDPIAEGLQRLIEQNRRMDRNLRELQLSLAGIRADFEAAVAARLHELPPQAATERQPAETTAP